MAIKKYANETVIKEKIQELFAYRKLNELLEKSQLVKNKVFTRHLTDIQYQIYLLDAYLESSWELEEKKLDSCWEGIIQSLTRLNYSEKQIKSLVSEIRTYQKMEMKCRQNQWPSKISMGKFYTTKSCDVRLLRNLIYEACPELRQAWKKKAWLFYDRITEIHDDIEDLHEDLPTYNINRFLVSLLRKGSEKTLKEYKEYIRNVSADAKAYFSVHQDYGENKMLLDWTLSRSKETSLLLEKTIKSVDHDLNATSLLLEHMA